MIRAVVNFDVKTGMESVFEKAFIDAGMFERPAKLNGFIDMELVQSLANPTEYLVISNWENEKVYAHWQSISVKEAPREALKRLSDTLNDPLPGNSYRVVKKSR